MTLLRPSLILKRLIVSKDGAFAYDQMFHSGVNVIRGELGHGNSVGKSTIADFIFFGLGGDQANWKEEAGLCDHVIVETELSGATVTLRRAITVSNQQPMDIFFGNTEDALKSAVEGWSTYPYKRYGDKESYSQVLFRTLGIPDVPGEAGANITMHQLLRVMYVDQMTPVDRIFRLDPRDSALVRQAVGDLLCGLFENELYPTQLQLRDQQALFEKVTSRYSMLAKLVSELGGEITPLQIQSQMQQTNNEIQATREKIAELKKNRFNHTQQNNNSLLINHLRASLSESQIEVHQLHERIRSTRFEIEDSRLLISSIEESLSKFNEGLTTAEIIGRVSFAFCPSCFAHIEQTQNSGHCHLCKENLDDADEDSRFARIRNELEVQLKESRFLQSKRLEILNDLELTLTKTVSERNTYSRRIMDLSENYVSESESEIDLLNSNLGYLDRGLEELERQNGVVKQLEELSENKAALNTQILKLQELVELLKSRRDRRQSVIYATISKLTSDILSEDILSEEEFFNNANVSFDFGGDRVTVNNKSGYSASSLTMIRNSFHLALHLASCEKEEMRYPRFLLMDNVEDKGMTQERSQNFQNTIVDFANLAPAQHQIIFTTSMISSDIDIPEYTIGDAYNFENKTLKFSNKSPTPSIFSQKEVNGETDDDPFEGL